MNVAMSSPQRTLLVGLVLLFVLVGAGLWLLLSDDGDAGVAPVIERGPAAAEVGSTAPTSVERDTLANVPVRLRPGSRPLEVNLELLQASGALSADGELPQGAGARARLRGSLNGGTGHALTGSVTFVAGTNAGRILETDAEGRFGANDLHPGLQIVEVRASGTLGALREIRLRSNTEEQLNIGFGMPASVHGRVIDTAGNPVPGAEVVLDGQTAQTDTVGEFYFPRVTPGHRVLALVHKQGFARFRQIVPVMGGDVVQADRLSFILEPGCDLQVTIQERIGADTQAQLFLLPDVEARKERKFPWHEVNPTPIHAGGTFVIEGLPAGTVQLALFHQGARAKARVTSVHLVPDRRETVVLHLEPAPRVTGRVLLDGKPVKQALVTLSAPDPALSTVRALGQPLAFLETAVLPLMPTGVQKTFTTPSGEFVLSGYWDSASARYLTAETADGYQAGVVVREDSGAIELHLEPPPAPSGELRLDLVGEHGGLPVDLIVDGMPREPQMLDSGAPLLIGGLQPGRYQLSLRWDSQWLAREQPVTLVERERLSYPLPEGVLVRQ